METVSEQIRSALRNGHKSCYRVSRDAGISQSQLSRFVHRRGGLSLRSLDRICRTLNLQLVEVRENPDSVESAEPYLSEEQRDHRTPAAIDTKKDRDHWIGTIKHVVAMELREHRANRVGVPHFQQSYEAQLLHDEYVTWRPSRMFPELSAYDRRKLSDLLRSMVNDGLASVCLDDAGRITHIRIEE